MLAIVSLWILIFLTEVCHIYYLFSSIVSLSFATVTNYLISSQWIWSNRRLTKLTPSLCSAQDITKKLRILVFNWRDLRNRKAGGAEVRLHEILSRIIQRGHECVLVTTRHKGLAKEEVINGILVKRIGPEYAFSFLAPLYYLYLILKGNRYDLVVEDISKIPLFTSLFVRRPLVGILHQFHGPIFFKALPLPLTVLGIFAENLL